MLETGPFQRESGRKEFIGVAVTHRHTCPRTKGDLEADTEEGQMREEESHLQTQGDGKPGTDCPLETQGRPAL